MKTLNQKLRNHKKSKPGVWSFFVVAIRVISFWLKELRLFEFRYLYPVIATMLLLTVIVPGYAYAGPGVIPGHILYPIKKAVEKMEVAIIPEKNEAKVLQKHGDKRIQEAIEITEKIDKIEENKEEETKAKEDAYKLVIEEAIENNIKAVTKVEKFDIENYKEAEPEVEVPKIETKNKQNLDERAKQVEQRQAEQIKRISEIADTLENKGKSQQARWTRERIQEAKTNQNRDTGNNANNSKNDEIDNEKDEDSRQDNRENIIDPSEIKSRGNSQNKNQGNDAKDNSPQNRGNFKDKQKNN